MNDREVDQDLSVEEAVASVLAELPEPVQRFVTGPDRDTVALELTRKYELHADQGADFEHAFTFMLLGLYSPEEFVQELRGAGISDAAIQGLATDVNERVFKRLRKEEQQGSEPAPARREAPPAVPVMQVGPRPAPPPQPPAPVVPAPIAQQPVPQPVAPPYPQAAYPQPAPAPAPYPQTAYPQPSPAPAAYPQAYAPQPIPIYSNPAPETHLHARTMAEDMQLASQGLQGQAATPASSFQTASVPVTYAPSPVPPVPQPPPLQAYVPPTSPASYAPYTPPPAQRPPEPEQTMPITAPIRLTPIDRAHDGGPIGKEFGTDPYREAIE